MKGSNEKTLWKNIITFLYLIILLLESNNWIYRNNEVIPFYHLYDICQLKVMTYESNLIIYHSI